VDVSFHAKIGDWYVNMQGMGKIRKKKTSKNNGK
jgi:hypothetical protein